MIRAALALLVSATAFAQSSPSYLDRHCAQQRADPQRMKQLMTELASGTPDQRSMAADTLSCFGAASREAVPGMIRLFASPIGEIQANAVAAVAYLGPVAFAALIEALDSSVLQIRNNAASSLGRMGPPANAALPKLRQLAAAGDPAYSPFAEDAIRRIEAR